MRHWLRRMAVAGLLALIAGASTGCARTFPWLAWDGTSTDRHPRLLQRSQGEVIHPHWIFLKIPTPVVRPGVCLEMAFNAAGSVVFESKIRVVTPKGASFVQDLSQLKGLVHVASRRQALQFVRLRTARSYEDYWPTLVYEVVNSRQLASADFADTEEAGAQPVKSPWSDSSGSYAVLSPAAYRRGNFAPPTVSFRAGRYVVTRYVCNFTDSVVRVQKWRETISPDGAYHLEILKSEPAPILPETVWQRPFEGRA